MTPEQRNMLLALVAMEAAAFNAALAAGGRFAEFALSRAELGAMDAVSALRAAPGQRQRAWENAARSCWRFDIEAARLLAGLPRIWTMLFLSELDRIRGQRPAPPARPGG